MMGGPTPCPPAHAMAQPRRMHLGTNCAAEGWPRVATEERPVRAQQRVVPSACYRGADKESAQTLHGNKVLHVVSQAAGKGGAKEAPPFRDTRTLVLPIAPQGRSLLKQVATHERVWMHTKMITFVEPIMEAYQTKSSVPLEGVSMGVYAHVGLRADTVTYLAAQHRWLADFTSLAKMMRAIEAPEMDARRAGERIEGQKACQVVFNVLSKDSSQRLRVSVKGLNVS